MPYIVRYVESADEILDELEMIRRLRPNDNANDILRAYAPLWLCEDPERGYALCGTDVPLLDHAMIFDTREDAYRFITESTAEPADGRWDLVEVAS